MTDLALILGALLVSLGVAAVYWPAGVIAGGLLLLAGSIVWERGKA